MHVDFHRNDAKGFVQEEEEGQPQMMCRCFLKEREEKRRTSYG